MARTTAAGAGVLTVLEVAAAGEVPVESLSLAPQALNPMPAVSARTRARGALVFFRMCTVPPGVGCLCPGIRRYPSCWIGLRTINFSTGTEGVTGPGSDSTRSRSDSWQKTTTGRPPFTQRDGTNTTLRHQVPSLDDDDG